MNAASAAAGLLEQNLEAAGPPGVVRPALEQQSAEVWMRLQEFRPNLRRLRRKRVVSAWRSEPASSAFDLLRTKVLRRLRQEGWVSLALTSPGPRCGKSLVALNLALSLANLEDLRVCLVDCDLKMPRLADLLGLGSALRTDQFLSGESDVEDAFRRIGSNLAVSAGEDASPNSARLLQSTSAQLAFKKIRETLAPTVILVDLPPMSAGDDVLAVLPCVEAVVLVAGAGSTSVTEVDTCERELAKATNVMGIVLNKCRYADAAFY